MSELKTAKDLQELYEDCMADDSRASRTTTSGYMIELIERIDAAESRVKQLERKLLSCVFCGFVGDDVEQLKAHSAVCEKHPIAALKSYNERLEKQVARFLEPISDEEWPKTWDNYPRPSITKTAFNMLIARRLEPKGENDGN